MSRIGKLPVVIPAGVTVEMKHNNVLSVKGPKGTLEKQFAPEIKIEQKDGEIVVTRPNDNKKEKSLHGLTRMNASGDTSHRIIFLDLSI